MLNAMCVAMVPGVTKYVQGANVSFDCPIIGRELAYSQPLDLAPFSFPPRSAVRS